MPSRHPTRRDLEKIYDRLFKRFGSQHWWPGETPFEVMVGAVLTQNTNWGNVEKAITNLKKDGLLTPYGLHRVSTVKLASLIRPSGYFNIKAKRLKNFISFFIRHYQGNVEKMRRQSLSKLREELLKVNGIGPETADSILLYALEKPIFVVDAYTRRILYRHAMISGAVDYHAIQKIFMDHLRANRKVFNEYHALIVKVGKELCRTKPRCEECPLKEVHYSLENRCRRCFRFLDTRKEGLQQMSAQHGCRYCRTILSTPGVSSKPPGLVG